MPNFVHLHLHTEYSIVDGIVRIEDLMPACAKAKMPAVAITDQCNGFGFVKFYKAARAAGIKPILGVDAWLENLAQPTRPFKLVLLAQNNLGYKNLLKLISASYVSGQTNGRPIIKRAWIRELNSGLIALSGGVAGDLGQAVLNRDDQQAMQLLHDWQSIFADRYYIELTRTGRAGEANYYEAALDLAERTSIPVVATNDVCFLNPTDFDAHEARTCISGGYVLEDPKRPKNYSAEQYLRTPSEMQKQFADTPRVLSNTLEIAKRCNVELELGKNFLPIFPVPREWIDAKTSVKAAPNNTVDASDSSNLSVEKYLLEQAHAGLEQRLQAASIAGLAAQPDKQIYLDRLAYELGVIAKMDFASYFLIVADFTRWARANGVPVGPGRGSGAGSLVAYALGITDPDPIVHGLLFERFLNPERVSMPDFDIDFCMEGRDRVIDYVVERYGKDRVAQIITYGTMAARAVVRDVGRVLSYPYGFVDKIAKLVPFEIGITLEKALEDEELLRKGYQEDDEVRTLIDLALKLEGITRNAGKHAGGVVIAPSQLTDFAPLYCEDSEGNSTAVTQFDKDDVEAIGLVKFDFLGLRTLTIINWALKTINQKRAKLGEALLDISLLPLDDVKTYKLLQNCSTTAVFQLESRGMRDLIKRLNPDKFDDIVALVALYRPGPLQSGMVDDFIARKHGREKVRYDHPLLEKVLCPTYGVILYQEQVMKIAQVLAGYSLGGADLLRKAMGKKKPEEMAKQRAIFLDGATKQNIDKHVANNIFDLMEKFAGYGFNKSHSVAYALIAYQTAWLKAHYPAEFMAAVLSSDIDNTDKVVLFLQECRAMGLEVLPPDVNTSNYQFTAIPTGQILYGLGAIKGAGQAATESIAAEREQHGAFKNLFEFCQRVDTHKVSRRVLEPLISSGAMDNIAPKINIEDKAQKILKNRAIMLASIDKALREATSRARTKASGQLDLFEAAMLAGNAENLGIDTEDSAANYVDAPELSRDEMLKAEKAVLGFYLSGHPLATYRRELAQIVSAPITELLAAPNKNAVTAGVVSSVRVFNTKSGKRLASVNLEDETGGISATLFAETYANARELLVEGQMLVLEGEVSIDTFSGSNRLRATSVATLENFRATRARGIILRLNEAAITEELLSKLMQIIKPYRANSTNTSAAKCPVYISYKNAELRTQLVLGDEWKLTPKDALLTELDKFLGEQNVVVWYGGKI